MELAQQLREAARQQDPLAKAAIELVQLSLDQTRESLVSAEGDDMLRQQGAARHLTKLLTEMTKSPATISRAEEKN